MAKEKEYFACWVMSSKVGVLLCGHGSRKPEAVRAFQSLVLKLQERYAPDYETDYGFLEFNHPLYEAAVERLYQKGVRTMYALPVILFAGSHAKNDIPYELNTLQGYYKDLRIRMARPIGVSSFLLQLAKKRIEQLEAQHEAVSRQDSCLLVVGRGTTDSDANSDVQKLMRMLWEGMGFGFGTVAYSGTAAPSVREALGLLSSLNFARIVVVPFFFFTGILLDRVFEEAARAGLKGVVCAEAFGSDEWLLKAFDERLNEAMHGAGNMNCQLCKYRKQMVGFEGEQGKDQIGHHLKVKGLLFEEEEKPSSSFDWAQPLRRWLGI